MVFLLSLLLVLIIDMICDFFYQSTAVSLENRNTSSKLVFVAWMVVSLVITAAYTGKLVSNAVQVPQQLPFQSMAELVQRDDYIWGTSIGGSFESMLKVLSLHTEF